MSDVESETEILHPEMTVEVMGETITVNEFTFRQGLALGPYLKDMMPALDEAVGDGGDLSGLVDTLYAYPDALDRMLLMVTGKTKEWFDSIKTLEEGEELVVALWVVNMSFFARRLSVRRNFRRAGQRSVKST